MAKQIGHILELTPFQEKLTPLGLLRLLQGSGSKRTNIICEDFEFRAKSPPGLLLTSAHLIGVVLAYQEAQGCQLYMQKASYAKSGYFTDTALKSASVYIPAQPHAMDAMRHFMQWYTFGPGFRYNHKAIIRIVQRK